MDGQRAVHEAEREIVVATRAAPRSVQGTLSGIDGGALDGALSVLAGVPVTSASLPVRAPGEPLTLDALLATANDPVVTDQRRARTLSPESEAIRLVGSIARPLGDALTLSLTGTLEQTERLSELGLPGYTLDVLATDSFSPFSESVIVSRLLSRSDPLERRVRDRLGALDVTFTGGFGGLKWSWLTELERAERDTDTQRDVCDRRDRGPLRSLATSASDCTRRADCDDNAPRNGIAPDRSRRRVRCGARATVCSDPLRLQRARQRQSNGRRASLRRG